jgi:hypothetical protein
MFVAVVVIIIRLQLKEKKKEGNGCESGLPSNQSITTIIIGNQHV